MTILFPHPTSVTPTRFKVIINDNYGKIGQIYFIQSKFIMHFLTYQKAKVNSYLNTCTVALLSIHQTHPSVYTMPSISHPGIDTVCQENHCMY